MKTCLIRNLRPVPHDQEHRLLLERMSSSRGSEQTGGTLEEAEEFMALARQALREEQEANAQPDFTTR